MSNLDLKVVNIEKPEGINFILGQSHFIKTVEDFHEALVNVTSGIKFGLAFCEASGPRLIRWAGTDKKMINLATKNMKKIAAGHSFIIFLGEGFYPLNILKTLRTVPEVVNLFCATANPTQVVVGETKKGRAIMGVIDGGAPKDIENEKQINERKKFLRDIGYKL
jgi:adenosine/AMP kinase